VRTAEMVSDFELAECEPDGWPGPGSKWIPALVPGGVHETLQAAGLIPEPYWGFNDLAVRWVEDRTWCYRAIVTTPPPDDSSERAQLTFGCLDVCATVRLDGVDVARHANQHRPLHLPLEPGRSAELLVRFHPALDGILPAAPAASEEATLALRRTRRRKAALSWGWDFAPRLPSIGISAPVQVVRDSGAAIDGVHVRTTSVHPDTGSATVEVTVDIDDPLCRADRVRLRLENPSSQVLAQEDLAAAREVVTTFELTGVELWWTHDLGDPALHRLRVELMAGDRLLDSRTERIGLRTIALDRSEREDGGRRFRFVLNGTPLFARGANWVPASMFTGSITDSRYRRLVEMATVANMNMLRVWGGGIYERGAFYEACDALGVLVWQDFMFACDDYPEGPEFRAEVVAEATFQVRRLRNHPALAIWCGNNEVQMIHQSTTGTLDGTWGRPIFDEDLPRVVEAQAPGALYWPGSPWGEDPGEVVNGVRDGDRHAWEVWHGQDGGVGDPTEYPTRNEAVHFRRYAKDHGGFISEFGIHAAPELATLRRWLAESDLRLRSPAIDHHNKDQPKDKGWALMCGETGEPGDLPEYIDYSMACQAEGLKFAVEHYRRRQPNCSGALAWQFNDPWPGLSWSVIDYDLVAKAGYYFLQRAFRPVVATFRPGAELELWVTNSSPDEGRLHLQICYADRLGTSTPVAEVEDRCPPHSSRPVWRAPLPPRHLVPWVFESHGSLAPNRIFLSTLQELAPSGEVAGTVCRLAEDEVQVELRSTGYSYLARVLAPIPGIRMDGNYLDLLDGQSQVVTVTGLPPDFDLSRLEVAAYGMSPTPCRKAAIRGATSSAV
jgi:beta-mannosidase